MWHGCAVIVMYCHKNFYSHIPCGMWPCSSVSVMLFKNFYSHIPCGMWLTTIFAPSSLVIFLLTHPVWDVTWWWQFFHWFFKISTHTSRVGCDKMSLTRVKCHGISTHTSRVGCDEFWVTLEIKPFIFLLTHPVWDVTEHEVKKEEPYHYFYSHIPCGMWPLLDREGLILVVFLLTHPVWDVTSRIIQKDHIAQISTHTSRVGCDFRLNTSSRPKMDFYSHIPCGMWQYPKKYCKNPVLFLLTHPVWDVTEVLINFWTHLRISTHTSRVGCDYVVYSQTSAR